MLVVEEGAGRGYHPLKLSDPKSKIRRRAGGRER